ncbi:MAG: PD40 domain-containing protein [Deltaproteobacteria bacterium]|nr:PD40 domain-containing protein [Deltaproteobacteria bacterium]
MLILSALAFAHPEPDPVPPEPKPAKDAPPTVVLPVEKVPDPPWDVDGRHGPAHDVRIDVTEGSWMDVTVHGDTVVFSLLGDLWSMPLTGGEAIRLTIGASWDVQPAFSPDGSLLAFASDRGGNEQLWVMKPDGSDARQVTDEDVARVTEPVWDPHGPWIYGRRRTVDTRSIGVTELWTWHTSGGAGMPMTSHDDRPHAGELVATDPRYLYFSSRNGRFEYNHDPIGGLWQIERIDRKNGNFATVVYGSGSASRPTVSPDGKQLVFVTRDRTKTLLEVLDVATGRRRVLADWLSPDELEAFALHGTYPAMDWTDDGALVLWAQGKLWKLGMDGQRAEIPFRVTGDWTLHDVLRKPVPLRDEVTAKVIRWPTRNADGEIAFSAMGALWLRDDEGTIERVSKGTGYAPAWSTDGRELAWTSWDDATGGRLHVTRGSRTIDLPGEGQWVNPAFSADGERLVALRGVGGSVSQELADQAFYEIVAFSRDKRGWRSDGVVTSLPNAGSATRSPRLHLHANRVWYAEDRPNPDKPRMPGDTVLVSVAMDGTDRREHLVLPGAAEVSISPDFQWVAYKRAHQLYVAPMSAFYMVGSLSEGQLPVRQITHVVGDWIGWSGDSKSITWSEGPAFKSLPIAAFFAPGFEEEPPKDPLADPPGTEVVALALTAPRARPTGALALTHARVVTMNGDEILEDATIVLQGDRIASINGPVPPGAKTVDLTGKTVIPGLIDVHAHLHYDTGDVLPEQQWEYLTALDFGVTTLHDPSASTDTVFTQAERVEAGFAKGPRIYSTGYILYGAQGNDASDTPTPEAAVAAIRRMAAYGAHTVKVYQQSQRSRRQWYMQACNDLDVYCIPEGGGDTWQNLGMVADGYQAIEHSLPTVPLYADIRAYFAGSPTADTMGTFYTPTLVVAYGGLMGENWFYQHASPLEDERLLLHFPRRQLDAQAWRRNVVAHDSDWRHEVVAQEAAALQDAGVHVTLGAHGQLQGLGVHWELWALGGPGAMSPHEALRAATIDGARYLGIDAWTGSIEAGKVADLVILDKDPLADIHHSDDIAFVVKNGERWPAED